MHSLELYVHGFCVLFVLFDLLESEVLHLQVFVFCLFVVMIGRGLMLRVCFLCIFVMTPNPDLMLHPSILLWSARVCESVPVNSSEVVEAAAILSHNRTLQACNGTFALALDHELTLA